MKKNKQHNHGMSFDPFKLNKAQVKTIPFIYKLNVNYFHPTTGHGTTKPGRERLSRTTLFDLFAQEQQIPKYQDT